MIPSHPPPPFLGPPPMLDETKSFSSVGNDKQSVGPHPGRPPKLLVAAIFLMFVVLRAMDRVFNKRVIDRMPNYQLMVRPFLLPPSPVHELSLAGWGSGGDGGDVPRLRALRQPRQEVEGARTKV